MINCIENKLCGFRYKIQIVVIIVYIFIDENKKVMTIAKRVFKRCVHCIQSVILQEKQMFVYNNSTWLYHFDMTKQIMNSKNKT